MYDIVIKNGTLLDPASERITVANMAIEHGMIKKITREEIIGEEEIDATGKIVCPGFIDIHTHVDGNEACARSLVAMGVTTAYCGNCGMGVINLEKFFEQYEKDGFIIHQLEQVGHTTLRESAGITNRYAPANEMAIKAMVAKLEELLKLGANGISFGLEYVPGSSKEEIVALSKVVARYSKLISIHTREDGYNGLTSLKEAISLARITGASVQVSHLIYQFGFGMSKEAIRLIDEARSEGLDITADSGMYSAFATAIGSAVFDEGCLKKWGCGYHNIVAATGIYRGKRLTKEMFEHLRTSYPDVTAIGFVGREDEVFECLKRPYVMVSSDAGTMYHNGQPGHPQDTGTYPRFIRMMVREQKRLSLMDAIKRCTYLPAKRLGLKAKGSIKEGMDADIVIFDYSCITDTSTYPCYGDTFSKPEGVEYVIVAGELVVKESDILEKKPGKIIRSELKKWKWEECKW